MKRISLALSLALLTALVWTYGAPAQSWELVYEGNNFPDDPALGDDAWAFFRTADMETSGIAEITPDGELHYADLEGNKVCFFMRDHDDLSNATLEARIKCLFLDGAWYTVCLEIKDGDDTIGLGFSPGQITFGDLDSYDIDMTEYHVIRIVKTGGYAEIYVDDEKVLEGDPGNSDDRHCVTIGEGSTGGKAEHYWDYVVYTTAGAFPPNELPNYFTSAAAVESEGKVATCWGALKY